MMITEANEIQDSQIVQNTKVEYGTAAGMIRFVYPGADGGTLVHSEWFNEQEQRRALLPWLAAVRQALVGQGQEREAQRRARARAARSATQSAQSNTPYFPATVTPSSPDVGVGASDPSAYVRASLAFATQNEDRLEAELRRVSQELMAAQAARSKWQTVADSLGILIPVDAPPSISADEEGE